MLAVAPVVVALDYGGVLRWTHYVAALAVLAAVVLAAIAVVRSNESNGLRQHVLLIPLMVWLVFACFQTVPLPDVLIRYLSPASAAAYTDWIDPFFSDADRLSWFPVSIAKHDSRHVCALLAVSIGIVWASATLFRDRKRIVMLLSVIACGASLHAAIGMWRLVFPETQAWSAATETASTAFGAFVNRNNAALMLNLGLAASLGLLTWRLAALSGHHVDDNQFRFDDLMALCQERDSFMGLIGAVTCIAGLLVCGSRGGLVAACFGLLLAFGWVRRRRGLVSIPVVASAIIVSVALLLIPLNLDLTSFNRLEVLSQQDSTTLLRDGRLMHWRDGFNTALAHLPLGSGFSTYAYAYLPHQSFSPNVWFHHADNLWLELLTEQGVVGILLVLAIIAITIRSLQQLAESPDPIDHGLRVAGWYVLAAVGVSQCLDFGLIALGNLLAVAVLVPAIVARGTTVSWPPEHGTSEGLFASHRSQAWTACLAFGSIGLICVSLQPLKRNAHVESMTREANARFAELQVDPSAAEEVLGRLASFAGSDPSPRVLGTLQELAYARARMLEVFEAKPRTIEQLQRLYHETGPEMKRLTWLQPGAVAEDASNSQHADEAHADYQVPLEFARQILKQLPLDPNARLMILYLDFVEQNPRITRKLLEQLVQLRGTDVATLVKLGQFAADSRDYGLAEEIWRQVLILDPATTPRVLAQVQKYEAIDAGKVLPASAECFRQAAPVLLQDVAKYKSLLAEALNRLECTSCDRMEARARCEEIRGDVAFALGERKIVHAAYCDSIKASPADPELRLKVIRQLGAQGDRVAARQEAQKAKAIFPHDERFKEFIGQEE